MKLLTKRCGSFHRLSLVLQSIFLWRSAGAVENCTGLSCPLISTCYYSYWSPISASFSSCSVYNQSDLNFQSELGCICSNSSALSSYITNCYSCFENISSQYQVSVATALSALQVLLEVCDSGIITAATQSPTTYNLLNTPTPTVVATAASVTDTSSSFAMSTVPHRFSAGFWVGYILLGGAFVWQYFWWH